MTPSEYKLQILKIVLGIIVGGYFVFWSLKVLSLLEKLAG